MENRDIRVRHSGEHLLVGSLYKLVPGLKVVRVVHEDTGVDKAFLRYDGDIDWETVVEAARMANRAITDDLPFHVEVFGSLEEARARYPGLRAYEERLGDKEFIRVVRIGDYDASACINPHVERASEVRLVVPRLLRRVRSGLYELEFYTGERAVEYALESASNMYSMSRLLGSSLEDLYSRVEGLKELEDRLEKASRMVVDTALSRWPLLRGRYSLLAIELPHLDMKRVTSRARHVMDERGVDILSVLSWDGERHRVFLASSGVDIEGLKARIRGECGGRGGGGQGMYMGYVEDPDRYRALIMEYVGVEEP